jgi:hypothetical protein
MPVAYLKNLVQKYLKQLMNHYYKGQFECKEPACKNLTRSVAVNSRCLINTCKGELVPQCDEQSINETLRYLQSNFDLDTFRN